MTLVGCGGSDESYANQIVKCCCMEIACLNSLKTACNDTSRSTLGSNGMVEKIWSHFH